MRPGTVIASTTVCLSTQRLLRELALVLFCVRCVFCASDRWPEYGGSKADRRSCPLGKAGDQSDHAVQGTMRVLEWDLAK